MSPQPHLARRLLTAALGCILVGLLLSGCGTPSSTIIHRNTQFGFSFRLPPTWKGYSIVMDQWQGMQACPQGDCVVQTGPEVLIRHPLWAPDRPRQDIPIMILTHDQWAQVQSQAIFVSPAPVLPRELGKNDNYVFALPPRYDYAQLPGWQEVDSILSGDPLHTP